MFDWRIYLINTFWTEANKSLMPKRVSACKQWLCANNLYLQKIGLARLVQTALPESLQWRVELHEGGCDGRSMETDVMGRRHGDQALDSGEGHGAALSWSHQTSTDPVLAIVLINCEHAIRPKTLHGQGHAVWRCKRSNEQLGWSRKLSCSLSFTLLIRMS